MKHKIISKIVVLSTLLALMFSAVGAAPAQAAGIYTHSIFVERAIERLTAYGGYSELVDILNRYPSVVNYGATFPDTTLAGIDDDWAEMLHDTGTLRSNYSKFLQFLTDKGYTYNWDLQAGWYKEFLEDPAYTAEVPGFRAALMGQVLDRFNNNPRSAEDEKMIAFLFGLIAHQESDIPWHWNCNDPNWRGLECAASADLGLSEYQLEMTVKYFHGGHGADFNYVDTVYNTILAASDAAGSRRPYCHSTCVAFPNDPIRTGNFNLSAYWGEPAIPPGWPWEWDGFNSFVYNHVPGGIYDGGALVAGAWMQTWDMLSSTTYYVKPVASGSLDCTSWGNACTLSYALKYSLSGQEIWVAAGTHKPTNDIGRAATFQLVNGVSVYGGFDGTETMQGQRDPVANFTILSGDIDGNDSQTPIITDLTTVTGNETNSYHVVTGATGATLDGFIITGGNANVGIWPDNKSAGGGMLNYRSSPVVANVTFSGNTAQEAGGGMINWDNSNPTLTNVTFSGNAALNGGGMNNYYSSPTLTNITFSGNTAQEAGGGMINNNSSLAMENVTFSGNSADLGGGMFNWSCDSVTLTNVTFNDNTAEYGGGIASHWSNLAVTNATFTGNTASANAEGILNDYSTNANIRNTILWDSDAIQNQNNSTATVSDSVVQDGYAGGTNIITTDPLLGTLGNYGGYTQTIPLLAGSPAIDAGSDADCPATDQRGVVRPQGAACDIGAYEVGIYTITFDSAGGSAVDAITQDYGSAITPPADPSRAGYTFAGWSPALPATMPAANLTLTAQWTANTYTVTFDGNGGSTPAPASMSVTYGSAYGTLATVSRAGYTFNGWYDVASGGNLVTAATMVATTADHTLYAQWTANTYTVTFDGNGGDTPVPTSMSVTYDSAYGTLAIVSRAGYTFNGWYDTASGGNLVTAATIVATTADHTLYAQWTALTGPDKIAPADTAVDVSLNPTLSWNQLVGATSYEYCYSSVAGPCTQWHSVGMNTSVTLNDLAPNYTYYWQVRAIDAGGTIEADDGDWWSFTTTATSSCTWPSYTPPAAPTFSDVPMDVGHWSWVERLANSTITAGCGAGNYCPFSDVVRAQMAIFLLRGKHCGSSYTPPAVGATTGFGDVPLDATYAPWVKQLAAEGITAGCGGGNFCPLTVVNRAQMAIFLLRAKHGATYSPPAVGATTGFGDVPLDATYAAWVKQLAAEGITAGCGNGNFCPLQNVNRAQMATFLVRAFGLP